MARVRRCSAAVYHRDCYRVDRRAGVPGGFSIHYNKEQCKRPSVEREEGIDPEKLASRPWADIRKDYFCWQHEKIADTPGAAYPEVAGYCDYM